MPTQLLPATPENIALASAFIRHGGLVAFPTETVYGLGANALDADGVARIFVAKERPSHDPLIVHLSGLDQLPRVARAVSSVARALAAAFWPGPLTLVLPKQPAVPSLVTSGLDTVAARVPDHPVAQALLHAAGVPIAAPSANRFGPTLIGVESTVLDVSATPPCILRPGGVTAEMLAAVIGPVAVLARVPDGEGSLPSPGLLEKHYAPRAELIFIQGRHARQALAAELARALAAGKVVGVLATGEDAGHLAQAGALVYSLGGDLNNVARYLYSGMRWLDAQGVDVILCRDFGAGGLGLAISDRLTRAAGRVVVAA